MRSRELAAVIRATIKAAGKPLTINQITATIARQHPDSEIDSARVSNSCFNQDRAGLLVKVGPPHYEQLFEIGRELKPAGQKAKCDPETLAYRRARRTARERYRTGRQSWESWKAECEAAKAARMEVNAAKREARKAERKREVEERRAERKAKHAKSERRDRQKAVRVRPALVALAKSAEARSAPVAQPSKPKPAMTSDEWLAQGNKVVKLGHGEVSEKSRLKHAGGHFQINRASWERRQQQ